MPPRMEDLFPIWNKQREFANKPYGDKAQILTNYFNRNLANERFSALAPEEQESIKRNYVSKFLGTPHEGLSFQSREASLEDFPTETAVAEERDPFLDDVDSLYEEVKRETAIEPEVTPEIPSEEQELGLGLASSGEGFFKEAGMAFVEGLSDVDLDLKGFDLAVLMAAGQDVEDDLNAWLTERKRRQELRAEEAELTDEQGFIRRSAIDAVRMAGPMAKGTMEGIIIGGIVAAAGQIGPQAALPEEVLTVPLATAVGAGQYWYRQGFGDNFGAMIDQGVPPRIAAKTALVVAPIYAYIEFSQVKKIAPGLERVIKRKVTDSVAKLIARNMTRFGADVAIETGEEVLQEITLAAGEEAGKAVSNVLDDTELEHTPLKDIWNRVWTTFKSSITPMAMLLGPKRIVGTARQANARRKLENDVKKLTDEQLTQIGLTDEVLKKEYGINRPFKGLTKEEIDKMDEEAEGEVTAEVEEKEELTAEKRAIVTAHVEEQKSYEDVLDLFPGDSETAQFAQGIGREKFGIAAKEAEVTAGEAALEEEEVAEGAEVAEEEKVAKAEKARKAKMTEEELAEDLIKKMKEEEKPAEEGRFISKPDLKQFLFNKANVWNESETNRYRKEIKKGKEIEPIEVVLGDKGEIWIVDGHHRARAAQLEGVEIPYIEASEEVALAIDQIEWEKKAPSALAVEEERKAAEEAEPTEAEKKVIKALEEEEKIQKIKTGEQAADADLDAMIDQGIIVEKEKPAALVAKKIPSVLQPMVKEARKYDSAKKFDEEWLTVVDKIAPPQKTIHGWGLALLGEHGFDSIEEFWEAATLLPGEKEVLEDITEHKERVAKTKEALEKKNNVEKGLAKLDDAGAKIKDILAKQGKKPDKKNMGLLFSRKEGEPDTGKTYSEEQFTEVYDAVKQDLRESFDHFKEADRDLQDWVSNVVSKFKAMGVPEDVYRDLIKRFYAEATGAEVTGVGGERGGEQVVEGETAVGVGEQPATGEGVVEEEAEEAPGLEGEPGAEPGRKPGDRAGIGEEPGEGEGVREPSVPTAEQRAAEEAAERERETEAARVGRRGRAEGVGENHVIESEDTLVPKGKKTRIRANIAAIKLIKKLEAENRDASTAEKQVLARYVGWGALAQEAFSPEYSSNLEYWGLKEFVSTQLSYYGKTEAEKAQKWLVEIAKELHPKAGGVLTEEEWKSALESTPNAHYTERSIVESIWDIVERLGFRGGTILEPAAGVGHFFGLMPAGLSESKLLGVELDIMTGKILQKLYPQADIQVKGFEEVANIKDNSVDLVVSNFPFGDINIQDKRHPEYSGWSIHNYFFARSLDALKPGGLLVAITSHHTLDAASRSKMRGVLSSKAELLGAVRLPNTAFKETAGTEVVTDVIIMRKRDSASNLLNQPFVNVREVPIKGDMVIVSEYFADNPDMVLGEHSLAGTMTAAEKEYTLLPRKEDARPLIEQVAEAIKSLPTDIAQVSETVEDKERERSLAKEGLIEVESVSPAGKVIKRLVITQEGEYVPVSWAEGRSVEAKRLREMGTAYVGMREAAKNLLSRQVSKDATDKELSNLRASLNKAYDTYRKKYGFVNKPVNRKYLIDDVEFPLVSALEDEIVDERVSEDKIIRRTTYKKADVFTKRTAHPFKPPTKAKSVKDAMQISILYQGKIDLEFMSKLLKQDIETIEKEMLDSETAYRDPTTGLIVDKATYLSGNVKEKLIYAMAATESDKEAFAKNMEALKSVIPEDIPVEKIHYRLGSTWIPAGVVEDFCSSVLDVYADVSYTEYGDAGSWDVKATGQTYGTLNTSTYGTGRIYGHNVLKSILNMRTITIKDNVGTSDNPQWVVNEEETTLARQKAEDLQRAFKTHISQSPSAATLLERIYNDKFNAHVVKKYEVPKIKHYPGASTEIELRPYQKTAVQRSLENSTLLDYSVGSGKTFIYITTVMEMRRLGLARKPMIVVQNSTIGQYAESFKKLYPSSKVLIPNENEKMKKNRQRLIGRIATGDYDAIIVPHEWFNMIPNNPDNVRAKIITELNELEELILTESEVNGKNTVTAKQLAKIRRRKSQRLQALAETGRRYDILYFENMGIDALLLDEAHVYKRSEFFTKLTEPGIERGAAGRSWDLMVKKDQIQDKTNGKNVIMATGTPISNTLGELWVFMRYLRPDLLDAYGITAFDSFAANFARLITRQEETATGVVKDKTRFAEFNNVREMLIMWQQTTGTILQEDLDLKLPKWKGGQAKHIIVPRTPAIRQIIRELRARYEWWENLTGAEKRENSAVPLLIYLDARKLAIDPRMVNEGAGDHPDSKLNRAGKEIARVYKASTSQKGTQLVFLDLDRGPNEFSARHELKRKLIEQGVPANEIALAIEWAGVVKKKQLIDNLRSGKIRVAIGHTTTLGIGIDAPDRMVGLHHVDTPMRPMDFEQRNGRIIRQGNPNEEVEGFIYGVKNTLDSSLFQMLLRKIKFINQYKKGQFEERSMEDPFSEDQAIFANMQAILSPLGEHLTRVRELEKELRTMEIVRDGFIAEQYSNRQNLEHIRTKAIPQLGRDIEEEKKHIAEVEKLFPDGEIKKIGFQGKEYDRKEGVQEIAKYTLGKLTAFIKEFNDKGITADRLRKEVVDKRYKETIDVTADNVSGQIVFSAEASGRYIFLESIDPEEKVVISLAEDSHYEINLENVAEAKSDVSISGMFASLSNRIKNIENRLNWLQGQLEDTNREASVIEEELKKGFEHEGKIEKLKQELEEAREALQKKSEEIREAENEEDAYDDKVEEEIVETKVAGEGKRKEEIGLKYGEEIGGSKYDQARDRLGLKDIEDMTEREKEEYVKKNNIWPVIDYEQLVEEEGVEPHVAWLMKAVKDNLPASPKNILYYDSEGDRSVKRKAYIRAIAEVSEIVMGIRTEADLKSLNETVYQTMLYDGEGHISTEGREMLEAINGSYTLNKATRVDDYDINKARTEVEETGWPKKVEAWRRGIRIRKNAAGKYRIVRKDARWGGYLTVVDKDFDTAEEAEAHLVTTLKPELEAEKAKKKKKQIIRPMLESVVRLGRDYRAGTNITPDEFQTTFGFRGHEFGKWLSQEDRQQSINAAYDALMDMADILNIPPESVGLSGELGFAFGARGAGKYAAHYEPVKLVINLTKTRGAGATAHEFAHALDDYYGRMMIAMKMADALGAGKDYTSGYFGSTLHRDRLQYGIMNPETMDAWREVSRAMLKAPQSERGMLAQIEDSYNRALYNTKSWLNYLRDRIHNPMAAEEFEALQKRMLGGTLKAELSKGFGWYAVPEFEAFFAKWKDKQGVTLPKKKDRKDTYWNYKFLLDARNRLKAFKEGKRGEEAQVVKSEFLKAAKAIDAERSKKYWSLHHEMFARAFESYIEDKLRERGLKSTYLVHGTRVVAAYDVSRPYPIGAERKRINEAFDKLFASMGVYKAEKKLAEEMRPIGILFSRKGEPERGHSVDILSTWLEGLRDHLPVLVQAVQSIHDLPARYRQQVYHETRKGGVIRGFYDPDVKQIWLIADNLRTKKEAITTVIHEFVGHYGARALMGEELDSFYNELIKHPKHKDVIQAIADRWNISQQEAAGEWFALQVQQGIVEVSLYDRLIFYLKRALRKLGIKFEFSKLDLRVIIDKAYVAAMRQHTTPMVNEFGVSPAYSLNEAEIEITRDKNFKRWFAESKVVDSKGKPLIVYHGTNRVFDTFNTANQLGAHFTPSTAIVSYFANREGGNVMPVYLNIKNPLRLQDLTDWNSRTRLERALIKAGVVANYYQFNVLIEGKEREIKERGITITALGLEDLAKQEVIRDLGYDGVVYLNRREVVVYDKVQYVPSQYDALSEEAFKRQYPGAKDSYIVFEPTQIKSIFNVGTFDPSNPDIRYMTEEPGQWYYSQLLRALDAKLPNSGTAETYRVMIENMAARGDFKLEELEWTFLLEDSTSPLQYAIEGQKISKDEILSWLDDNNVQVREVRKGEKAVLTSEVRDLADEIMKTDPSVLFEEAKETARLQLAPTKFAANVLPGGENYREVLITLPTGSAEFRRVAEELERVTAETKAITELPAAETKYKGRDRTEAFDELVAESKRLAEETDRLRQERPFFTGGHWDESNVLAHLRLTDRTDAEGNKILFIEEAQSDWGLKGRQLGWIKEDEPIEIDTSGWVVNRLQGAVGEVRDSEGTLKYTGKAWELTDEEIIANAKRHRIMMMRAGRETVPRAPFVEKSWPLLVMKKALRIAAEGGYDKIGWTTGEQQAERYDLSKHLSKIIYEYNPKTERYLLRLYDPAGSPITDVYVDEKDLPDHIGKEAAGKIVSSEGVERAKKISDPSKNLYYNGVGELSGLDLKIGAEWAKNFYDKQIPNIVNRYVKKWGGKSKIDNIVIDQGLVEDEAKLPTDLEIDEIGMYQVPIHTLDITPPMQQAALAGQPLFRRVERWTADERNDPVALRREIDDVVKLLADLPPVRNGVSTLNIRVRYENKIDELQTRLREADLGLKFSRREETPSARHEFVDKDIQGRIEEAHGIKSPPMLARISDALANFGHKLSREYEYLPKTKEFAELRFGLLRLAKQKAVRADITVRNLKEIIRDLDTDEYWTFNMKVMFDDFAAMLAEDQDVGLPFGLNQENFDEEYARLNETVAANPKIGEAIAKRNQRWGRLKTDYIQSMYEIGFGVEDRLTRKNYFRHQVLEYLKFKQMAGTGKRLKTPAARGFLKKRMGSEYDINSDYLQAEFEVMGQMAYDIEVANTIKLVDDQYNIVETLKLQAAQSNEAKIMEHFVELAKAGDVTFASISAKKLEEMSDEEIARKLYHRTLTRKQLIGFLQLGKLAEQGDLPLGKNSEYESLVDAIAENYIQNKSLEEGKTRVPMPAWADKEVFIYLKYLIGMAKEDEGRIAAATIFKGIQEKRKYIKETLAKDFVTWEDLVPDGYSIWQPRPGNVFFLTESIPANVAQQLTEIALEGIGIKAEQLRTVLALGGRRKAFVLKNEVSATLDNLVHDAPVGAMKVNKAVIRSWKIWQLISPRRWAKYNLRNLTGDADAVFAGNPRVFKFVPAAIRELYAAYSTTRKLSGNIKDWFERGGTISTLQAQEMGELNKLHTFADQFESKKGGIRLWMGYWKAARITTDLRESILRYAAYLETLDQQDKNEGRIVNYGASKRVEIDGLKDRRDKAFWVSNSLCGAYDRVGYIGQELRTHWIPFWSWQEVNFTRYVQLFRNAAEDNRLAEAVGRKVVGTTLRLPFKALTIGRFLIKATAFLAMIQVMNRVFFPDDDDELPANVRNRPHITLGRDANGNIIYFSRVGALGDLLEWLNLDATPFYVNQIFENKMSVKDAAYEMFVQAPVNKLVQGMRPFIKMAGEAITRRSLYPDLFKPGTVRDRAFHIARSFGLTNEYNAIMGKPSRGYKESLAQFFIYKSDPLAASYWDSLNEKRRFLKSIGKGYEGFHLTRRGMALYHVKQAIRYKDYETADQYLEEYYALGGTNKGLRQSFKMMHPEFGLNKDEKEKFVEYLGPEGRARMVKAIEFYDQLMAASYRELPGLKKAPRTGMKIQKPASPSKQIRKTLSEMARVRP